MFVEVWSELLPEVERASAFVVLVGYDPDYHHPLLLGAHVFWRRKKYTEDEVNAFVMLAQIRTLDSITIVLNKRIDLDREDIVRVIDLMIEDIHAKVSALDAGEDWRKAGTLQG